jgi:hypothetical protein
LGILRVIEEILENKPDARIVINSLFPMSKGRGGQYPLASDFKDSLQQNKAGSSRVVKSPTLSNFEKKRNEMQETIMNGSGNSNASPPRTTSSRSSSAKPPRSFNGAVGFPGTRRDLRFRSREYANPLPPRKQPQSEEGLAEAADKEEEKRDKAYHKKHDKKILRTRERASSDVLGDSRNHKIRKYNAKRGFLRKNKIPLWTSIQAINDQLKKFAASHERVTFFDANEIFTITDAPDAKRGVAILNRSRMTPRGHPTEMGYSLWEDAILKRLDRLFEVMKREQPDLFNKKAAVDDDIHSWIGEGGEDTEEDDDFDESAFDNKVITDDLFNYGLSSGDKYSAKKPRDKGISTGTQGGSVDGSAFGNKGTPMGNQGGTGDGITSGSTGAGGLGTVTGTPLNGQMYGQRGSTRVRESTTPGVAGGRPIQTGAVATAPVPAVNAGSMYGALGGAGALVNPNPVPAANTMYGPIGGVGVPSNPNPVPAANTMYGPIGGVGVPSNPNPVPAANTMYGPIGGAAAGTDNGANVEGGQVYGDFGDGNL